MKIVHSFVLLENDGPNFRFDCLFIYFECNNKTGKNELLHTFVHSSLIFDLFCREFSIYHS